MVSPFFSPTPKSLLHESVASAHCSEYARFALLDGPTSLQTHLQAGSRSTIGINLGRVHAHPRAWKSRQTVYPEITGSNFNSRGGNSGSTPRGRAPSRRL